MSLTASKNSSPNKTPFVSSVYVHPQGLCESTEVGLGTRVWAFAHVMKDALVGNHCNIGEHCFVESGAIVGNHCTIKNGVAVWGGVSLEDHVFIGPYCVFTNVKQPRTFLKVDPLRFGKTQVGFGATIGANATIVCGVTIGKFAFVGAGTVVTKSIPDHALAIGSPGKVIARVCFCGERLDSCDFCTHCELPLAENSVETVIGRASGAKK